MYMDYRGRDDEVKWRRRWLPRRPLLLRPRPPPDVLHLKLRRKLPVVVVVGGGCSIELQLAFGVWFAVAGVGVVGPRRLGDDAGGAGAGGVSSGELWWAFALELDGAERLPRPQLLLVQSVPGVLVSRR